MIPDEANQEVGGAARQQPDGVVEGPLVERLEPRPEGRQGDQLLGIVAERVRRHRVEQRLHDLADAVHVVAVLLVGVGVVRGEAADLPQVGVVVLGEPQVLALRGRGEARRHEQRQEPVLGELQLLDHLGPQQGQGVGEGREPEAGAQLLGDRGAADQVALFEDEGPEPALGQVGAVDQAVVAAADDDRVVSVGHGWVPFSMAVFRGGLYRGRRATWAATFW
jgi:hypothetical protein